MQQFQSLKRLLAFYTLTLLIMLVLYYAMIFLTLNTNRQEHSQAVFADIKHELSEHVDTTENTIEDILTKPFFQNISYQLILMQPSGQTYVYRYTQPGEHKFTTVAFPNIEPQNTDRTRPYKLTAHNLTGMLKLENGQQLYIVLRHQPIDINWVSYQYWLPLIIAIMLFIIALLYMLKRRANWEQLLQYTDNLMATAKDAYTPPPFDEATSTPEFLRLGHSLGRISYQLHNKHRRIKRLSHRLERLVEHAPLPMLMIMRQGHISFFNPRFEQVFTTSFQRDTIYMLTDFVSGSDKATQQQLQKLDAQRVTRTLLVYGLEDKQAYQLHITPWFGEHDQIHGFTALFNNIDKLVSQNTELQQQNQQLDKQVLELTQLKAIIGHELRTPLNAIIGTLDLIEPRTLSAKQQEVLTTLTQSSQSMLAMLNDMLDMAKIGAGKLDIVHVPVDIFKVSQHVSDLMVGSARRQGLELLYFFMPDCPRYISTDGNRLRQILLNLLDNAVKFTTSGYVALIVEPISYEQMQQVIKNSKATTLNAKANLQLAPQPNTQGLDNTNNKQPWLHFSIQDTGIGINSAEHRQLFAYFNQANPQISQQFGGTGLGLAISSSFAQLLGGFIQLTSEKGLGSTFHLYLPSLSPTYQPVYHFHANLKHIHLIAIVNQSISAIYLQRLCQHLSIRASIYSSFDENILQQLTDQLAQQPQTHAPVLLLDYEYYIANILEATNNRYPDQLNSVYPIELNGMDTALYDLVQSATLPKILLSMKPERGISSTLLDKFDGFLSKPLDIARLLSELIRLTQPTLKALKIELATDDIKNSGVDNKINSGDNKKQPVTDKSADATPLPPIDAAPKPLILVVEDNLTNQKITCKLLSKLGYDSVVAADGLQALDKLSEQRQAFALILMDCRMPVMDGLQATQAIRSQGDDIAIIALTANNSNEDREACLAAGMDEFLTKPINKNKLQALLQQFISTE
ncbi:response regulator [Psychrobacter frigidicola]|uniref:histidine kinase n=1 Tax=Psychrobacter frigidicola TaxID=45611 RepID=A0A5C7A088_9GAMM|nr:response regulator [Psychrobacter frigidicola]TXD96758.1 response regulator [Psychrobacter frigidicola]